MNTVSMVGYLTNEPSAIEATKNSNLKIYEFNIYVFREGINSSKKKDIFLVQTYYLNLKRYVSVLKKDFIIGIEGRLINENNKILIFADNLYFLGNKK